MPKKGSTYIRGNDDARFLSCTKTAGECIEWIGTLGTDGYGKFMVGPAGRRRTWRAHRWAFFRAHGYEPEVVRHACDNPKCVRIEHLEPGTPLDNVQDSLKRGRRPQRLTAEMVSHLRLARSRGECIATEAARLGVPYFTAYQAVVGKSWRHVK